MTRRSLPNRRQQLAFAFRRDAIRFTGAIGFSPSFDPLEVFLSCDKTTEIEALGRDASVLISLALQHGCSFDLMRHAITRNEDGSPCTLIGQLLDEVEKIDARAPLAEVPKDEPPSWDEQDDIVDIEPASAFSDGWPRLVPSPIPPEGARGRYAGIKDEVL